MWCLLVYNTCMKNTGAPAQLSMLPNNQPVIPTPERVITVTGSRVIKNEQALELLEKYASQWLGKSFTWLVGGAIGLDYWCIKWLLSHNEDCIAVVPFTISEQPTEVQPLLKKLKKVITLSLPNAKSSYARRNQYMVDASSIVVGFWADKRGTYRTLQYALRKEREVHAIHVLVKA